MNTDPQIEKLRAALQPRLSGLAGSDYDGIVVHSSSIVICADAGGAKLFGYDANEITGVNAWAHFKPECARTILQRLTERSEDPYTVTALTRDGTEFEVELKGKDFDVDGTPVRAVLVRKAG